VCSGSLTVVGIHLSGPHPKCGHAISPAWWRGYALTSRDRANSRASRLLSSMSASGQSRPNPNFRVISGLPPAATIRRTSQNGSFVPESAARSKRAYDTNNKAESDGTQRRAHCYSGRPAARSASPSDAASAGAQLTPENWRLKRNVGCNSSTLAAATFASFSRPSLASAAANCT
jgi:hypothetical protein